MHTGDKTVKFPANNYRIYLSKPDKNVFRKADEEKKMKIIEVLNNLQTVGGNKKGSSKRQYKRALVARKLYHMAGAPKFRNLKMMIRKNIIQNFLVTVEDIETAERIFGPDVSTLKARTTRQGKNLLCVILFKYQDKLLIIISS